MTVADARIPDPIAAISAISSVPTILRVITEVTGLRLSLIAHVTDDEWTCCAVNDQLQFGLEVGGHLDVATTLCSEVRAAHKAVVISHASQDATYCEHRTPKLYKFESYISVPIFLRNGDYFGNVCALDANPTDLSQGKTLAMFQLFAELVGGQLEAEARHAETSQSLLDARATAELREQFIALLGHDLRTPLSSVAMGAEALADADLSPADAVIVARISRSAGRMTRLVNDVLDFARGRLGGGGVPLDRKLVPNFGTVVMHVVAELQSAHPQRAIALELPGSTPVYGDVDRLAQLVQNLLGNALTHSPATAPVRVAIRTTERDLELVVANGGPRIPEAVLARMFEPYHRGTSTNPGGLGLGLYIASQIVRSHGGSVAVESTDAETIVTCKLPRDPAA